ncbi:hypothetical protein R1flu_003108 [Riccia fluitans]|uniref:Uncharacterized protein n=1 Tax=Riccia fluitans TaxID=41844 RepID=A0ABD1Y815_9MARC
MSINSNFVKTNAQVVAAISQSASDSPGESSVGKEGTVKYLDDPDSLRPEITQLKESSSIAEKEATGKISFLAAELESEKTKNAAITAKLKKELASALNRVTKLEQDLDVSEKEADKLARKVSEKAITEEANQGTDRSEIASRKASFSEEQAEYDVRQTSPSRESQAADSKSSEGILRPDVLSLGFHAFDDPFDSERILLLHVPSSEKDGSEEIYLFHHEGMALLFGVGVPHSKVMFKSDTGAVLDGVHTSHVQEARSRSSSEQYLSLSPQQNLLFPFASFFERLHVKSLVGSSGDTGSDELPKKMNKNRGIDKLDGNSRSTASTDVEVELESEPELLQVTVVIHLDPNTCTCTWIQGKENENEASIPRHMIKRVLTLKFFKEQDGDQTRKGFDSTLKVELFMKGEKNKLDDPSKFGWYHDQLELSFRYLLSNAVTIASNRNESVNDTVEERSSDKTQDTASRTHLYVKDTNFVISLEGGPEEIGCSANVVDDYNIWNQKGRKDAFISGIMSYIPLVVKGNWSIWNEGLCDYQLIGMRSFIMKKKNVNPPKPVGRLSFESEDQVLEL